MWLLDFKYTNQVQNIFLSTQSIQSYTCINNIFIIYMETIVNIDLRFMNKYTLSKQIFCGHVYVSQSAPMIG
jgi:hypothetical protein